MVFRMRDIFREWSAGAPRKMPVNYFRTLPLPSRLHRILPQCCRNVPSGFAVVFQNKNRGTRDEKVKRRFLPSLAVWRCLSLRSGAALLLVLVALASYRPAFAQEARKVKTSVQPQYPELARANKVYGSARLEVLIARDGTVKQVKILGGSPLLVQASVDAVKQWKYEPAANETNLILKFDFKP